MLLANAVDHSTSMEIRHAFISILEDSTPFDALILDKIYDALDKLEPAISVFTGSLPDSASTDESISHPKLLSSNKLKVSIGNLIRLGLLESSMICGGTDIICVYTTPLGVEFIKAISKPEAD